jgi:hypothetical protein
MLAFLEAHTGINSHASDHALLESILGKEQIQGDLVGMGQKYDLIAFGSPTLPKVAGTDHLIGFSRSMCT